jgi:predicted DNA-binding ribbon-helix-helix protein
LALTTPFPLRKNIQAMPKSKRRRKKGRTMRIELVKLIEECSDNPQARQVHINGRLTMLQASGALWDLLGAIAEEQGLTLAELCSDIAGTMNSSFPFAQAARCYCLGHILSEHIDELPDEARRMFDLTIQ